ncbi:hypothetical protein SAMN05421835_12127 [Amycolatopsis sacchari]|uniref:Uncharacterized protein n=1 Tax=Amycolatopsis sacchari TaxID=115433 RepID=A0A1I3ZHI5_9PSEU|nr:hypothetical protein SAMN05421835_12127 [Amycolatopsis sacchari]
MPSPTRAGVARRGWGTSRPRRGGARLGRPGAGVPGSGPGAAGVPGSGARGGGGARRGRPWAAGVPGSGAGGRGAAVPGSRAGAAGVPGSEPGVARVCVPSRRGAGDSRRGVGGGQRAIVAPDGRRSSLASWLRQRASPGQWAGTGLHQDRGRAPGESDAMAWAAGEAAAMNRIALPQVCEAGATHPRQGHSQARDTHAQAPQRSPLQSGPRASAAAPPRMCSAIAAVTAVRGLAVATVTVHGATFVRALVPQPLH